MVSDLNIKLGSYFSTNKGNHYVMSQIFSGSLFVEQTINCVAYSKELNKSVNDLNNDIIQGKKYSSISQTIEEIKFEVSNVETNILDLQKQVDGAISTWYYEGEPTLTNIPASDWTTEEDKIMHIGDLYYDKLTGYAYRFMKDESIYTWVRISDEDITKALESAQNAQETADGKRTIYYTFVEPTGTFNIGDLWVNGSIIRVWNSINWVLADDYAQNSHVNELVNAINASIKETNDAVTSNTENISKLTQTAEKIQMDFVSKTDTTYVGMQNSVNELSTSIKFDLNGVTISGITDGQQNPTKLNINSSGVYIKDNNDNVITSMTTNEFRTGVWVLQQTNDNNSFNIFKEQ